MLKYPGLRFATNLVDSKSWKFVVLQGIVAILTGIFFLVNLSAALIALTLLLGVMLIGCGFQKVTMPYRSNKYLHRFYGAILVLAGVCLTAHPLIGGLQLLLVLGVWLVFHAFELLISAWVAKELPSSFRSLVALNGLFSLIFGALILRQPIAGAVVVNYIFTFYLLLYGVVTLAIGLRLRRMK